MARETSDKPQDSNYYTIKENHIRTQARAQRLLGLARITQQAMNHCNGERKSGMPKGESIHAEGGNQANTSTTKKL
jgi:hypothetical protein